MLSKGKMTHNIKYRTKTLALTNMASLWMQIHSGVPQTILKAPQL